MLDVMLALWSWLHAWIVRFILAVLAAGPVPQHVGFVMDGNRRYARKHGQRVLEGHGQGLESLKGALDMCLRLGVKTVSVYAFAIDNFNRPKEEVEGLMTMAHESLLKLCDEGELLNRHSIKVKFIGRRNLLTDEIRQTVIAIEERTKLHNKLVLYICSPYSSRDEITGVVRETVEKVERGELAKSDITDDVLKAALPSGPSLDLLIRTSDVHRLSDFQLWQCSTNTQIHFVKAYWPQFGVREMLSVVLRWQRRCFIERYWDSG